MNPSSATMFIIDFQSSHHICAAVSTMVTVAELLKKEKMVVERSEWERCISTKL